MIKTKAGRRSFGLRPLSDTSKCLDPKILNPETQLLKGVKKEMVKPQIQHSLNTKSPKASTSNPRLNRDSDNPENARNTNLKLKPLSSSVRSWTPSSSRLLSQSSREKVREPKVRSRYLACDPTPGNCLGFGPVEGYTVEGVRF